MMLTLALKIFKPFPCFIQGPTILFSKIGDVNPPLSGLAWQGILDEKSLGKAFPSDKQVRLFIL